MHSIDWEIVLRSLGNCSEVWLYRGSKVTGLWMTSTPSLLGGTQVHMSIPLKRQTCMFIIPGFSSACAWAWEPCAFYTMMSSLEVTARIEPCFSRDLGESDKEMGWEGFMISWSISFCKSYSDREIIIIDDPWVTILPFHRPLVIYLVI